MRELKIYVDQSFVGTLGENNDIWVLDYDPAWAKRDDSFDLSPALPRTTLRHLDGSTLRTVQWYFDNLLPEEGLRLEVVQEAGIKEADAFALLQYLGAESAGSLTLLPPGAPIPQNQLLQSLPYSELSKRIRELPTSSLSKQAPKRMSLAGAQHKLLVVLKGPDIYEPAGATPSTHILKPDHRNAETFPASTFLEYLTMRMADAAGLEVPSVYLLQVPEPVYIIERFDRSIGAAQMHPQTGAQPSQVRRLHIIDACQLLNEPRSYKWGRDVEALRKAIECTGDILTLPVRVFRWLVFNLLVANDDCHLKNLSFLVSNTVTLAPHYDLLATGVYNTRALAGDSGKWPNVELAIRLAGNVSTFGAVTPEAVLAAAETLGVPNTVALRVTREVVTRTFRFFDRVYAQHYPQQAGLLATQQPSPVDMETLASADSAQIGLGGVLPNSQLSLTRHILRVMRYIILPEMSGRLLRPSAGPQA